jgi:hypothetical protein
MIVKKFDRTLSNDSTDCTVDGCSIHLGQLFPFVYLKQNNTIYNTTHSIDRRPMEWCVTSLWGCICETKIPSLRKWR